MRNITISKGLDIPISGEVTDLEITKQITNKVAVLGKDYHDLKPTMLVKVGAVSYTHLRAHETV
mgnify:FL=1